MLLERKLFPEDVDERLMLPELPVELLPDELPETRKFDVVEVLEVEPLLIEDELLPRTAELVVPIAEEPLRTVEPEVLLCTEELPPRRTVPLLDIPELVLLPRCIVPLPEAEDTDDEEPLRTGLALVLPPDCAEPRLTELVFLPPDRLPDDNPEELRPGFLLCSDDIAPAPSPRGPLIEPPRGNALCL